MAKLVILSVKRCYRLVRDYSFLLAFIYCMFLLYRSCPLLFSLLISASPVIVCTAVLLGTLLSFGKSNLPEVEKEERVSHGSFTVEMFIDSQKGVIEDNLGMIKSTPLINNRSFEVQFEKQGDYPDIDDDDVESGDDDDELENGEVESQSVDSCVGSSKGLKGKEFDDSDDEDCYYVDEVEDEDSGSDRAESSSPDASMADILPLLDELHPFLSGEEASKLQNHESKSAISCTDERNNRLENHIARRRARQTLNHLINFDESDLPFNVPQIATTRQNPFDSSIYLDLPPIPGSAPSILLQRKNLFDLQVLPDDPNEETIDEFMRFHQKESLFRRHASFRVPSSNLGGAKLRPYFVSKHLEGMGSSGSSDTHEEKETSFELDELHNWISEDTHEEMETLVELDELKDQVLEGTHEVQETSFELDELKDRILEDTHEEEATLELDDLKNPSFEDTREDKETSFRVNELKDRFLEDTHEEKETSFELDELKDSDTAESNLKLPVLEMGSTEDITMSFMQLNEGADFQQDESGETQLEYLNSAESSSKLPALEVRSLEDIEMAFLQMNEGADLEEIILPSSIINLNVSEEGSSLSLHTVEARSPFPYTAEALLITRESDVLEATNVSHEEPGYVSDEAERIHGVHSANLKSNVQEISKISHERPEIVEVETRKLKPFDHNTPRVPEDVKPKTNDADESELREKKVLSRSSIASSSSSSSSSSKFK